MKYVYEFSPDEIENLKKRYGYDLDETELYDKFEEEIIHVIMDITNV